MVEAAQAVADGKAAIGTTEPRLPQARVRSLEGVYPKEDDWRALSATGSLAQQAAE
jgi:phthalate 4,5-dioxygenase oxygenase subunit